MALSRAAVWELDPQTYARHALHATARTWPESNCYVDLWIELLHAAGREPLACLGFTFATDFELDQFTFIKPPAHDLEVLYGASVYELSPLRSLIEHALVQLSRGAIPLVEVDAFYLPDTSGTDYRRAHVKTTIGIERLDLGRRSLGYFHNAGYFALEGADFDGALLVAPAPGEAQLPPYVELARFSDDSRLARGELVERSRELARAHLRRRPADNPIARYAAQFARDFEWLVTRELPTFHAYAFATLRQLGASCELGARYLGWLEAEGVSGLTQPSAELDAISRACQASILKLARAVNKRRPAQLGPALDEMAQGWQRAMDELARRFSA